MAQTLKFGKGTWATKTGSSMAYNDQNGNYKPLPFNVERDSIATRVNKEGLIEVVGKDKLRIDYTDSAKGVALLENSSTNLITYSEDFSQSYWNKSGLTLSSNDLVSPDGGLNASKLTNGSSNPSLQTSLSLSVGTTYTISVFVKKETQKWVRLAYVSSTANGAWFDLDENIVGTVNSISATIENYGNGWYRITNTLSSPLASGAVLVGFSGSDGSTSGAAIGDACNIWGMQVEQNSFATSYIPTSGSTVQRQADVVNGSGNSEVFNDSEGVLFADIAALADDSTYRNIGLTDNTINNRILLQYSNISNRISGLIIDGGASQASLNFTSSNIKNYSKVALKYKVNDVALWVNGFEIGTDTSATMPSGLNTLSFDNSVNSDDFYGKAKELGYYDATLTDAELETLTSYRSLNELVTELNLNTL